MRSLALCCLIAAAFPIAALAGPPSLQQDPDAARLYDLAAREAQYQSLLGMPAADIEYGKYGRVRMIKGSTGVLVPDASRFKAGDSAAAILHKLKPVLMASGSEALAVRLAQSRDSYGGGRDIFMDQSIDGIPVIDGGVNVRTNKYGEIVAVSSLFIPDQRVSREPKLSLQAAKKNVEESLVSSEMATASSIKLAEEGSLGFWTDQGKEEKPRLVWLIQAGYITPSGEQELVRFGVDAGTGEVRVANPELFGLNRTTYSLHGLTDIQSSIPAGLQLLWNEGSPNPADSQAYSAYNLVVNPRNVWAGLGENYDTFAVVAHWGVADNAAYTQSTPSGYPYLIFGDLMATELDAVAHEYGHGVYRRKFTSVPGSFWNEWHAVNEFYADLSAVMTDIAARGGEAVDTWLITSRVFRDLSNPTSPLVDNPAASYRDWYPERRFCCNRENVAYSNATIFGHALYLITDGGYHARRGATASHGPIPSIFIQPAPSTGLVHAIFAYALNELGFYQTPISAPNLKAATVGAARILSGDTLGNNIANAWTAVGVGYSCSAPPSIPSVTIEPYYCGGGHSISWVGQSPGDKYHGERVRAGLSWDLASTVVDSTTTSCTQTVGTTTRFRLRACNGCGCSDWSPAETMQFYQDCL